MELEPMFKLTGEINDQGLCSVNVRGRGGKPVEEKYVFGLLSAIFSLVMTKANLTFDEVVDILRSAIERGQVVDKGKVWKN